MAHPSNWMFRCWKKQHFSNRRPHPHEVFSKDKVLFVVVPYPKKIIELFEAHKITEIYKSSTTHHDCLELSLHTFTATFKKNTLYPSKNDMYFCQLLRQTEAVYCKMRVNGDVL